MKIAIRRGPRNDNNGSFWLFSNHPLGDEDRMPVQQRYTGQYQDDDIPDLYFYNARWYDAQLGRFLQADTLVPGMDGLAWDRYAYARNSPVVYNDPSGHDVGCTAANPECADSNGLTLRAKVQMKLAVEKRLALNKIDRWLWNHIPTSAVGIHAGGSVQAGLLVEGGYTPWEGLLLINWRSGEITIFWSSEGYVYIGTPTGGGINGYWGLTSVDGLSKNQYYAGQSLYGGVTASGDVWGKLGVCLVGGRSITGGPFNPNPETSKPIEWYIDPASHMPIEYNQASITIGWNAAANGADFGIIGGFGETKKKITYEIPFWPFRW